MNEDDRFNGAEDRKQRARDPQETYGERLLISRKRELEATERELKRTLGELERTVIELEGLKRELAVIDRRLLDATLTEQLLDMMRQLHTAATDAKQQGYFTVESLAD